MNHWRLNLLEDLKKVTAVEYKGFEINRILISELNFLYNEELSCSKLPSLRKSYWKSRRCLDFSPVLKVKHSVLFTFLRGRKDYLELLNGVIENVENSKVFDLGKLTHVQLSIFSFKAIVNYYKALKIVSQISTIISREMKYYFIAQLANAFNQIDLLTSIDFSESGVKKYVSFNSSYKVENYLSIYFDKIGICTYTLQHGVYVGYLKYVPFDVINYTNINSKFMFCWGNSTIRFLSEVGIDKTRLLLAGNPKYKNIDIPLPALSFKTGIILLGRNIYNDSNIKLLRLLVEKNPNSDIAFFVKMHPSLDSTLYEKFSSSKLIFVSNEDTVSNLLKDDFFDFAISVNTTSYYEAIIKGKICFRWSEFENENLIGLDDKFSSLDEFNDKLLMFQNSDPELIQIEMRSIIDEVMGTSLQDRYAKYLNS